MRDDARYRVCLDAVARLRTFRTSLLVELVEAPTAALRLIVSKQQRRGLEARATI